jgi:membrane protease subunit HflC
MKHPFTFLVAGIIVVVLLAYMFCFQVRYDQVAILTTFDKATEPTRDAQGNIIDPGSLRLEPGLYRRWPWPIQQVTTYPKLLQVTEAPFEELQTADHYAVVMRVYVVWKIEDPLKFFVKLQNIRQAEDRLGSLIRELKSVISQRRFDELVNLDPTKLKFAEIEEQSRQQLQAAVDAQDYGISIQHVGIRKMVLPEKVTEKVFARMKKNREALAQQARSEGESRALGITSEAEAAKERILGFAQNRALAIRTEGDRAAAEYYSQFAKDQQLAIFLRQIEALKIMLPHNTTFILPAEQFEFLNLMNKNPGVPAIPAKPATGNSAATSGR